MEQSRIIDDFVRALTEGWLSKCDPTFAKMGIAEQADSIRRELCRAISHLPGNTWIPVLERLPKAKSGYWSDRVLCYTGDGITAIDQCYNTGQWRDLGCRVTHWMPLPKPPSSPSKP